MEEQNIKMRIDVADLLRDRLALKLTEVDLDALIEEVSMVMQDPPSHSTDKVDKLRNSIDYIDYKCRAIERSLRASDRHVRSRRERFRDRSRSPLGGITSFGGVGLDPMSSSLTHTRAAIGMHPRNPWFDSYFS